MTGTTFDDLLAEGDGLRDSGDPGAAMGVYGAALKLEPGNPKAHFKLATAHAKLGNSEAAEQCYRDALRLDPQYVEALGNLGVMLFSRGDWDEAEICYRKALANDPDYFQANLNLSRLLLVVSRNLESLYFARRASTLNPGSGLARERIGKALAKLGQIGESLAEFRRAIEIDPTAAGPWVSIAGTLQSLGQVEEADRAYLSAIERSKDDPTPRSHRAFWSNYQSMPRSEVWLRHKEYGDWLRSVAGAPADFRLIDARPDPERRIRVGFISADLRRHSVGYFVRGALEHLSRRDFQLYAYFDHHGEDQITVELKPLFHQWRDIFSKTDDVVIEQVRRDDIDILVDLAGLTGANRMPVFARRAAPVQMTYLGYPNTTGLDSMDFRLTDMWADPRGDGDEFHSERLWRLPGSFLCYSPPRENVEVAEPPMLANGYVTFGSFNNRIKISDECLQLWVRVLNAVPASRLILKSIFGTEDDASRQGLVERFAECGIDRSRVEVHAQVGEMASHLGMYSLIDIALDTFPYNGTTTTCEALWMGVPVVVLKGDRHAARVGESLLNNCGLAELIASSADDYLALIGALASSPDRLSEMRKGMRARLKSSRLVDSRALGADMGAALRGMWHHYCGSFDPALPLQQADEIDTADLAQLMIGDCMPHPDWSLFQPIPRQDIVGVGGAASIGALLPIPLPDLSCSRVYVANFLERLRPHEILPALNDIHRILVPGGILYLRVPDVEMLAAKIAGDDVPKEVKFNAMRLIFGMQETGSDINRIGLSFDFLVDYLADVGFSSAEHVERLDVFDEADDIVIDDMAASLNLIVVK